MTQQATPPTTETTVHNEWPSVKEPAKAFTGASVPEVVVPVPSVVKTTPESIEFGPKEFFQLPELKIYKTHPDVPDVSFGSKGAACFDLRYAPQGKGIIQYYLPHQTIPGEMRADGVIRIKPQFRYLIPTGLRMQIPQGCSVRVHPRSGLAIKSGITLVNCEGVIDSDYIDEIFITLLNISTYDFVVSAGDRIAQAEMMIAPKFKISYIKKPPVPTTDRKGGFGSTGVK